MRAGPVSHSKYFKEIWIWVVYAVKILYVPKQMLLLEIFIFLLDLKGVMQANLKRSICAVITVSS